MYVDRLDAMVVFVTAVSCGSLSAAGRKLGMPLATVSRKLSELEKYLNARLLTRSTRLLELTDVGRDYLLACKRILEDVSEAERTATGEYNEPRGELVISAPIVFGRMHVLPLISGFLQAYPAVDVRFLQGDRTVNLIEDHIDLAIRIGPLADSDLVATRVGSLRRVVCASPHYLAQQGTPTTPTELGSHRCISFEAMGSSRAWRFTTEGIEQDVPVRSRLVVNTAEAAVDAAIAGAGVTRLLSYQVAPAIRAGQLERLLQPFEPPPIPVSVLYAGQRRLPLKLRAFLDFFTPRLRALMESIDADS